MSQTKKTFAVPRSTTTTNRHIALAFVVIVTQLYDHRIVVPTNACSCWPPAEPFYCNSDYFVLVQILSKSENPTQETVRYRFQLLQTLADRKGAISKEGAMPLGRPRRFFTTSASSSMCGIELNVGARYLISANATMPNGNIENDSQSESGNGHHPQPRHPRLMLSLCRTFVQQYEQATLSEEQLRQMLQKCSTANQINT